MISRRRFLSITAAVAFLPSTALARTSWHGRAFGADVSIELAGTSAKTRAALDAALDTILRMEKYFSIYNPKSQLSMLNRNSHLLMPPEFERLINDADAVHRDSNGLFDPTVQPIFSKLLSATGQLNEDDFEQLRAKTGWSHIQVSNSEIRFTAPNMALTLNGIAQGFATDRVTEVLAAYGFNDPVVNIGEYRVGEASEWLIVHDGLGKEITALNLSSGAVATSSFDGYRFENGASHIISRDGNPKRHWNTVSVVADTATRADGYSTALMLTDNTDLAEKLIKQRKIRSVIFVDRQGKKYRLQ